MTLAIETGLNRLTSSIVWVDMSLELPLSLSLCFFFTTTGWLNWAKNASILVDSRWYNIHRMAQPPPVATCSKQRRHRRLQLQRPIQATESVHAKSKQLRHPHLPRSNKADNVNAPRHQHNSKPNSIYSHCKREREIESAREIRAALRAVLLQVRLSPDLITGRTGRR